MVSATTTQAINPTILFFKYFKYVARKAVLLSMTTQVSALSAAAQTGKAAATFTNSTAKEVQFEKSKIWTGTDFSNSPGPIAAGASGEFGGPVFRAAVWYTGKNADNKDISWIVAWDAPEKSTTGYNLKVAVWCGSKVDMDNVTHKDIIDALTSDNCSDVASDSDTDLNVSVDANIVHDGTDDAPISTITATLGLLDD